MLRAIILAVLADTTYGAGCSALSLANGQVIYNPPPVFAVGTSASALCNSGFSLVGTLSTICNNDNWQYELGQCVQNNAPPAAQAGTQCLNAVVLGGKVTYDANGTHQWNKPDGATVTVECNRGYELNGPSQAKCSNGMWTPTLGICLLKTCTRLLPPVQPCSALAAPAGASLTYSNSSSAQLFASGTLAIMNCTTGYPEGPRAASCTNGTWTPSSLGTCTPMATPPTAAGKCSPKVVLNGRVDYSDNGVLKFQRDDGAMATLTCFSNMVPEGPTSSYCQNGTWTPELGTCYGRCLR
ncbi:sushi domain protein [Cooperia oncophora]